MNQKTQKPIACIILPTFNEGKNIPNIIPKIVTQQSKINSHTLSILIVDSNSQDNTKNIVSQLQQTYPQLSMVIEKQRGLGKAYIKGFHHAIKQFNPEYILQMDADGQHDPEMIPLFIQIMNYNFDCVIGSRFTTGGKMINYPPHRQLISTIGNSLIRIVGGIKKIQDSTSGFRCIRASVIKKCSFKQFLTTGYAFQSSLISELLKHKARIMECPIIFHERDYGNSKLRLIDKVQFIFNLFLIRLNQSSQFIKYCCVGLSGIFINIGCYTLITRTLDIPINIAIIIAIELSIITNFIGHHRWTFKKKKTKKQSFTKRITSYHLSVLVSSLMNIACFYTLVHQFNIFDIFANALGILSGFFANYLFNTKLTWKEDLNQV